jgi:alcohol dehydrogenase class IV
VEPVWNATETTAVHEQIITWQAPELKFGVGATREIGYEIARAGLRSVLLVTDSTLARLGLPDRVARLIEQEGISVEIFDRTLVEPTDSSCTEAAQELAGREWDGYLALGGGSSMDCAKGINFVYSCGGRMQDYWGVGKATKPMLPMIAVPTTAGTGSEAQSFAVISHAETHAKMACGDKKAACRIADLDPALTLQLLKMQDNVAGDVAQQVLREFAVVLVTDQIDWKRVLRDN